MMIKHQLLVLIVCSAGVAACVPHHARTQAASGTTPELVYADSPAVWFEDMASAAVLENGRRLVVGEGSARRVLGSSAGAS